MKILIYDTPFNIPHNPYPIQKAFEDLGHTADTFDWTKSLFSHNKSHLLNRLKDKFLFKKVAYKINKGILSHAQGKIYDMILVLRGEHLTVKTLKQLRNNANVIANWNTDDLFSLMVRNTFIDECFSEYDIHFSPRPHLKSDYINKGAKRFEVIDWYYRPELNDSKPSIKKEFKYDYSFVGSWSIRRMHILSSLNNFKAIICGWGWMKNLKSLPNPQSVIEEHVKISDIPHIFQSSKINVNILTKENRDSTNLRNYEIAASGGFQVTEWSERVIELFQENEEIVCFKSPEELREKVAYYLEHDEEREKIALAGYNKIVNGKNSLSDRIQQILNKVNTKAL